MHEVAGGLFALTHVVGLCEGARTHSLCGRRTPGCSHLRAVVCSAVVSIPAARSERSRVAAWCGLEAHGRARVSATSSPQQSGLGPALCSLSSPRLSVYFLQLSFSGVLRSQLMLPFWLVVLSTCLLAVYVSTLWILIFGSLFCLVANVFLPLRVSEARCLLDTRPANVLSHSLDCLWHFIIVASDK